MMAARQHGPLVTDRGTTFRLWAPGAKSVSLVTTDVRAMAPAGDGWFSLETNEKPGVHYRFRIDDKDDVPDPASHFQPQDVNGPSEVVDHRYDWRCNDWKGRPWHEAVFIETHVGTFTSQRNYRGLIERLDHIASTGITALELMPIADYAGGWNWGYDGVLPYAPDHTYGRPDDLRALIDAAHERGLMVFLDVVYNHFGPEGNHLHRYAPSFFTQAHTPWGSAINYELDPVRSFAVENALHWVQHYRFDGLRLDAVHAIVNAGQPSVLSEISKAVGAFARESGRHIHLVLENDDNIAGLLDPKTDPAAGRYRAQWNDDAHHAWHVLLTGETSGYYQDYADAGPLLARTLAEGFAYQGEPSAHRSGKPRGEQSGALPPTAFVSFIQNHDQIGNRARGERLTTLAKPEAIKAALSVLLLSPSIPLLFMGEEWGAQRPFPFFCNFKGDLADAVREGRKKEFADAYAHHGDDIPDPLDEKTIALATLDWQEPDAAKGKARLALVRDLLKARRQLIVPILPLLTGSGTARFENGVLSAQWGRGLQQIALVANLSDAPARGLDHASLPLIWGEPTNEMAPWSVRAWAGAA